MASPQQLAPAEPDRHPTADRRGFRRYLLWALLIPVVAWVAAFPLVCSRSYEQWGETEWGPVLEFPYEAGTPDADVVIFGDSSAFLGVDPRLINQELGIHSVVLPSTVGSLPVIGDAPLRQYLAHHRQPRLIVLYFSPWNLDFAHAAPGRLFEGEEMMLRHATTRETLHFERQHPLELLAFPFRLYSTFGSKMLLEVLRHRSVARDTAAGLGHTPFTEPYPPLDDLCRIPSEYLRQFGDASVAALRSRYEQGGTRVMVYLAPVPACTNSGALRGRSVADLGAAAPILMPPPDFAADLHYAHVLPAAVPFTSKSLAVAVEQALRREAPELLREADRAGDGTSDMHRKEATAPRR